MKNTYRIRKYQANLMAKMFRCYMRPAPGVDNLGLYDMLARLAGNPRAPKIHSRN
jgi:hypothetical protein